MIQKHAFEHAPERPIEHPARTYWTDHVLQILGDPQRHDEHVAAASLLPLVATANRGAEYAKLLCDQQQATWIRIYALRTFRDNKLPIDDASFDVLLAEFAATLLASLADGGSGNRQRPAIMLASADRLSTLPRLTLAKSQRRRLHELLARLPVSMLHKVLFSHRCDESCPCQATKDYAYQLMLSRGHLDAEADVAWWTLERESSRVLVLTTPSLSMDKLGDATADMNAESIAALFADHPQVLQQAVQELALPVESLLCHMDAKTLISRSRRQVEAFNKRIEQGERDVSIRRVLSRLEKLPGGIAQLDEIIADNGLTEAVRLAAGGVRLDHMPQPIYELLPRWSVVGCLRRLGGPLPRYRGVYQWAVQQDEPQYQYAGLMGLEAVDGQLPPALIEKYRGSSHPLLRLLGAEAAMRHGGADALEQLVEAARNAPHVVLRAQALRSWRTCDPDSEQLRQLCMTLLFEDTEMYDDYYSPVTAEAALGLAWHKGLASVEELASQDNAPAEAHNALRARETESLAALVDFTFELTCDEAWWAVAGAISSWLDRREASINPIWYWSYARDAQRSPV